MKVVIYTRVSTVEQAEKNKSLEVQEMPAEIMSQSIIWVMLLRSIKKKEKVPKQLTAPS